MSTKPYSPYIASCPTRQLLDRVGDRWTMLTIGALADGTQRYSALARSVQGVSQKMLTQTLRALERDGLLTRTVYPEIPPHVEYDLTELGQSLLAVVLPLKEWALTHMDTVQAARDAHDAHGAHDAA